MASTNLAHALAVFDTMAAAPDVEAARVVLDWIIRTSRFRFTRRDAFTGPSRARFRKVSDLDPGDGPHSLNLASVCR